MNKKNTLLPIFVLLTAAVLMAFPIWGQTDNKAEKSPKADSKKSFKVTFVELGSVRCIPCKKMQKVMTAIEKEYGDQVKIVFHDVWTDEGKPYAKQYKIRLIPTQVFLDKDGKEFFRHEGFFPKDDLVKVLKKQGVTDPRVTNPGVTNPGVK